MVTWSRIKKATNAWLKLQVIDKPLLFLEDIFEFSQCRLHLFQREVLFLFCTTILSDPGIEFVDGVVEEFPFLDQSIGFLHPFIRNRFDFVVSFLETSNFNIGLFVGGHFVGSGFSVDQNGQVLEATLVKVVDINRIYIYLYIGSLHFLQKNFSNS